MKSAIVLIMLCCIAGCDLPDQPILQPPIFARGDVVKLKDSEVLGIVTFVVQNKSDWTCSVMFSDTSLEYSEKNLVLFKHAEWHVPSDHKPEIDDFKTILPP
jgi:hypothetical protein